MAFPPELPAMRRLTLAAPHPVARALAWAALSYATGSAVLLAPLPHLSPDAGWALSGSPAGGLGVAVVAGLLPALAIAVMARRAPTDWPATRYGVTYLAMLGLALGLQLTGASGRTVSQDIADCCAAGSR